MEYPSMTKRLLAWLTTWREHRRAMRLHVVQLEHRHWVGVTATDAIRRILACADRRREKGQDTHELFAIIAQIVDLWERDTSPEAWRAMLLGLKERGVLIPVEALGHDTDRIDRR
jgi:hypothetical protein